jgi:hypothetical protein
MKKVSIILIFVFGVFGAYAQKTDGNKTVKEKRTPEEIATAYTDRLVTVAGIDESQKTKIYDLKLKEVQDLRELRGKKEIKGEERKQKVKEIVQAFRAELKVILTPEQKSKLKAELKKNKANKKGKKGKKNQAVDEESTIDEPTEDL